MEVVERGMTLGEVGIYRERELDADLDTVDTDTLRPLIGLRRR